MQLSIPMLRPTVALIDTGAIADNVAALSAPIRPAMVCCVIKADGYGHGSVTVARAAIEAGADWFAVALVEEGIVLRRAGITKPILVLSEFPAGAAPAIEQYELTPTVYSFDRIAELNAAAMATASPRILDVHMKIDTGMRRVGAQLNEIVVLARAIEDAPGLRLGGTFTHFAVSDETTNPFTDAQLDRFDVALQTLRDAGVNPGIVHAANSGGSIVHRSRGALDMVRLGVALYGHSPDATLDTRAYDVALRQAMTLRTEVSHVKNVSAGEAVSYGLTWTAPEPRTIATIPIGYADGVPRRLGFVGATVLLHGQRRPIAGRVTMDQILIDAGPADSPVRRGDEVVLLGRQGDEEITAWEWATMLDTIAYEITCGISARVPRVTV